MEAHQQVNAPPSVLDSIMASMDDAQKQNPETRKLTAEMAKNTLTSPRANNYKPPAPSPKTPVANTSQENFVSHLLSMFWGAKLLLLGYIHPRFFFLKKKPMQFHQEKFSRCNDEHFLWFSYTAEGR